MASVSMVPSSGFKNTGGSSVGVDRLPGEMNDMRIRDDKVNQECKSGFIFFSI